MFACGWVGMAKLNWNVFASHHKHHKLIKVRTKRGKIIALEKKEKKVPSLSEGHDMKCQFRLRVSIMSVDSFHWKFSDIPTYSSRILQRKCWKMIFPLRLDDKQFFFATRKQTLSSSSCRQNTTTGERSDQRPTFSFSELMIFNYISTLREKNDAEMEFNCLKMLPDTGSSWPYSTRCFFPWRR